MFGEIKKLHTDIFGLDYIPSIDSKSDGLDRIELNTGRVVHPKNGNGQFTDRNGRLLRDFWMLIKLLNV